MGGRKRPPPHAGGQARRCPGGGRRGGTGAEGRAVGGWRRGPRLRAWEDKPTVLS